MDPVTEPINSGPLLLKINKIEKKVVVVIADVAVHNKFSSSSSFYNDFKSKLWTVTTDRVMLWRVHVFKIK